MVMIIAATSCFESEELLVPSYHKLPTFEIQIPDDLHISHMLPADSVFSSVEYIPLGNQQRSSIRANGKA
jgi:hypothetical protein